MRKLIFIFLVLFTTNCFADDFEFLVRTEDKLTSKKGDCITYKPVGWTWGDMERKHFQIILVKGIDKKQAQDWCNDCQEEIAVVTTEGKPKTYQPKVYKFDIDSLTKEQKDDWLIQDKEKPPIEMDKSMVSKK